MIRIHPLVAWASAAALLITAPACEDERERRVAAERSGVASATPVEPAATRGSPAPAPSSPTAGDRPRVPPAPDAPIERSVRAAARSLVANQRALDRAIRRWRAAGSGRRRVELEALYQQRIYRALARDEDLATRVLHRLPARIRGFAQANVTAGRALLSLVVPIEPPIRLHPRRPEPPDRLLMLYKKGERQTGIRWELLASVNFVESKFGRVMGPSTAGALGPMQFLPSTWELYGNGGDIRDPHDSILAAARYLSASGAPEDTRGALFAYNRSLEYVDAIQIYARQMMRDPDRFYAYYFWQVFVATTRGDVQLTGPGSSRA